MHVAQKYLVEGTGARTLYALLCGRLRLCYPAFFHINHTFDLTPIYQGTEFSAQSNWAEHGYIKEFH